MNIFSTGSHLLHLLPSGGEYTSTVGYDADIKWCDPCFRHLSQLHLVTEENKAIFGRKIVIGKYLDVLPFSLIPDLIESNIFHNRYV